MNEKLHSVVVLIGLASFSFYIPARRAGQGREKRERWGPLLHGNKTRHLLSLYMAEEIRFSGRREKKRGREKKVLREGALAIACLSLCGPQPERGGKKRKSWKAGCPLSPEEPCSHCRYGACERYGRGRGEGREKGGRSGLGERDTTSHRLCARRLRVSR